jgi:tetratricopeptide (TPR) repeat protein
VEIRAALEDWDQAAMAYEQAAILDLKRVENPATGAAMWPRANQPDRAVRRLEEAVNRVPAPEFFVRLAQASLASQAGLARLQRQWGPLERALERLPMDRLPAGLSQPWRAALVHANYVLLRSTADGQEQRGIEEAETLLASVEQQYGDDVTLWPELALRYERMGRPADTDRALARCQDSNTPSAQAALLSSGIAVGRKDYPKARQILTEAIAALPKQEPGGPLRQGLAQISLLEGNWDAAEGDLSQAHEDDPTNVILVRPLSQLSEQTLASAAFPSLAISVAAVLQDGKRAETLAKRAVDSRPSDPTTRLWYGHVLWLNRQPE